MFWRVVEWIGFLAGALFTIGERAGEMLAGDIGALLDALDTAVVLLKNIMDQAQLTFWFFSQGVDLLVSKLGPIPDLLNLISDALDIDIGEGLDIAGILAFFGTFPFKISLAPLEIGQTIVQAISEAFFGAKPKIEQDLTALFTQAPLYTKMPIQIEPNFSVDPSTIANVQAKTR